MTLLECEKNELEKNPVANMFLHKIGGFDLLSHRPIITKNKCIFVLSGHNIRKYLATNGNFVDEYTFGNKSNIIAMQENTPDSDELLIVFEDGMIVLWNYLENIKISESFLKLTHSDSTVTYFNHVENYYYFVIKRRVNIKRKKFVSQLYYCLKNQLNNVMIMSQSDHVNDDSYKSVAFSKTNKYCATIYKHLLFVYEIPVKVGSKSRSHFINQEKQFICLNFHPTEPMVATGDSIGQIFIWNSVMSGTPSRSIMHWHSQPVSDLAFSPSGTYLYSAGAEMVLVRWNLVGKFFGEKSFLPRLGSPVKFIVIENNHQFVITSHEDQSLQIIDTQFNGIRTVIEGLSIASGFEGKLTSGLHFDNRLNTLALNGRVGHVQFYSPSRQKQLFQLDVVQQNVISEINVSTLSERIKENKNRKNKLYRKIFPIEVTKLAISNEGSWLATTEYRNDRETLPEIRLKFWSLKKENTNFVLNTTIHLPHQDEITFMSFSPVSESRTIHLVTTSKDKSFKIWDLNVDKDKRWWNCSRNASLNTHSVPVMAAFSSDASLISVLFDNIITLWELDLPNNIRYIPRIDIFKLSKNFKVIFLEFGTGIYSHYLIEGRASSVTVCNVIKKFEVVFTHHAKKNNSFQSMVYNQYENHLALLTQNGIDFLSLETQTVIFKVDFSKHTNFTGTIISAVFSPEPPQISNESLSLKSSFYCINEKNELFVAICKTQEEIFEDNDNVILVGSESSRRTELFMNNVYSQVNPLSLMMNQSARSRDGGDGLGLSMGSSNYSANLQRTRKSLIDKFFFNVPSHVLPPIGVLCKPFLTSYFECINVAGKSKSTASNNDKTQETKDKKIHFQLDNQISTGEESDEPITTFLDATTDNGSEQTVDEDNRFSWFAKYFKNADIETSENAS